MKYQLKQIHCRPWTLSGLSLQAHRKPLREQLRRGAAAPERHHRAARVARLREDAGLRHQRPEARGADRAQFDAAARALLREPGRRRQADQARCREALARDFGSVRALARRVRRDGQRARRRLGLGAAHLHAARRPAHQPVRVRAQPGRGGRHPDPRARHVRARLPHRLRRQRDGLRRHVHAQRRLEGGRGALRGRDARSRRRGRWCSRSSATCPASASRR